VSGNSLLDASNNPVRFAGVNRSGSEYACVQGWGIFDGDPTLANVQAIASWHVNAVRVLLNEDCWLGINGIPAAYAGANYQNAIVSYVNLLNANGMYVELSLIWGAPGTYQATYQPNAPDQDHSPAFWTSVATTFKSNPNVIFGVWGETTLSWSCFKNGCSNEATYGPSNAFYTTAGTQELVGKIRATGATQPISVPCIDYANNCSDANGSWLTNKPTDTLNPAQLVAEAHIYGKNTCDTVACFNSTLATTAAAVPMIFGETGETYDDSDCGSSFIAAFMGWADSHNVGYEAWTWDTWGTCGVLISDYAGTPANAFGSWVKAHYAALASSTSPTVSSVAPNTGTTAGGTPVIVTGTNFTGATAVKFGATAAVAFGVTDATHITATSPAGSGIVDVKVTTPSGTSANGAGDRFTYVAPPPPPPIVTGLGPTQGSASGGTSVTITGTNFTGATAVQFGTSAATSYTVNSATKITATSPGGRGTVDVTVTTAGGTSLTGVADRFTYLRESPAQSGAQPPVSRGGVAGAPPDAPGPRIVGRRQTASQVAYNANASSAMSSAATAPSTAAGSASIQWLAKVVEALLGGWLIFPS
jgi:hypothetical protein